MRDRGLLYMYIENVSYSKEYFGILMNIMNILIDLFRNIIVSFRSYESSFILTLMPF